MTLCPVAVILWSNTIAALGGLGIRRRDRIAASRVQRHAESCPSCTSGVAA